MEPATGTYPAIRFTAGNSQPVDDILSVEQQLSIHINGEPFTITMRTPGDENELVRGILHSELIYTDAGTDPKIQVTGLDENGYITGVNVIADAQLLLRDFRNNRNLVSVSSCGICGKSEDEVLEPETRLHNHLRINAATVYDMFRQMSARQQHFSRSGGTHAAAAFSASGELLAIHEDIGRHNATDKVIGSLLLKRKLDQAKCIIVSGRISFEIASKTLRAGIPFLAAVSAPSSLAVEYCDKAGITLMAFCREDRFTVYTHPEAVAGAANP